MKAIPKIIHQIWEGRTNPLPDFYKQLGETWKKNHPDWKYELWDGYRMESFVHKYYPNIENIYLNYPYDVQRWDVIRYLILHKMGGMYVDFDYECIEPFENYIKGKGKCYFAMEPDAHRREVGKDIYFNNALMLTPPGHPFFECLITHLQTTPITYNRGKINDVLYSTGPLMLTNLYENYDNKTCIDFFSSEQVSPWSKHEVQSYIRGRGNEEILENKLEKAIAIHYFWGSWIDSEKP